MHDGSKYESIFKQSNGNKMTQTKYRVVICIPAYVGSRPLLYCLGSF